jgi:hypothetical protein
VEIAGGEREILAQGIVLISAGRFVGEGSK